VARGSLLGTIASTAANSLAAGTEEPFHTVQIADILASCLLLSLALAVVNLLVCLRLLEVAAVISETRLSISTSAI